MHVPPAPTRKEAPSLPTNGPGPRPAPVASAGAAPCGYCGTTGGTVDPRKPHSGPVRASAGRFGLVGVLCERCDKRMRYRVAHGKDPLAPPRRAPPRPPPRDRPGDRRRVLAAVARLVARGVYPSVVRVVAEGERLTWSMVRLEMRWLTVHGRLDPDSWRGLTCPRIRSRDEPPQSERAAIARRIAECRAAKERAAAFRPALDVPRGRFHEPDWWVRDSPDP